jgi:hypothetical protein
MGTLARLPDRAARAISRNPLDERLQEISRPQFFFRQAGVLPYCLICVQKVSVGPNSDDELRDGIDDGSKFSFGFGDFVKSLREGRLRSLSLDRNYGYMTCRRSVSLGVRGSG